MPFPLEDKKKQEDKDNFVKTASELSAFGLEKIEGAKVGEGLGGSGWSFSRDRLNNVSGKKIPHPLKGRIEGLDYWQQISLWHRLTAEGMQDFSKLNPNQMIDPETREWGRAKGTGAASRIKGVETSPTYWEKYGVKGVDPFNALYEFGGLNDYISEKELSEGKGMAGGLAGMAYGLKIGARGGPITAALGAGLGGAFGQSFAKSTTRYPMTAGEAAAAPIWWGFGSTAPTVNLTKTAVKEAGAMGFMGATVSEFAKQTQNLIDRAAGADIEALPNDAGSIFLRNWKELVMYTVAGGISHKAVAAADKSKGALKKYPVAAKPQDDSEALRNSASTLLTSYRDRLHKKQTAKGVQAGKAKNYKQEKAFVDGIIKRLDKEGLEDLPISDSFKALQILRKEMSIQGGKEVDTMLAPFVWDNAPALSRARALGVSEESISKYPMLSEPPRLGRPSQYTIEVVDEVQRIFSAMQSAKDPKKIMTFRDKLRKLITTDEAALGAAQRIIEKGHGKQRVNIEHLATMTRQANQKGMGYVKDFDDAVMVPLKESGLHRFKATPDSPERDLFNELLFAEGLLTRLKGKGRAIRELERQTLALDNAKNKRKGLVRRGEKGFDPSKHASLSYDEALDAVNQEIKSLENQISSAGLDDVVKLREFLQETKGNLTEVTRRGRKSFNPQAYGLDEGYDYDVFVRDMKINIETAEQALSQFKKSDEGIMASRVQKYLENARAIRNSLIKDKASYDPAKHSGKSYEKVLSETNESIQKAEAAILAQKTFLNQAKKRGVVLGIGPESTKGQLWWSEEQALALVQQIEAVAGPARFDKLMKLKAAFVEQGDKALKRAYADGLIDDASYSVLSKSDDLWATFALRKYLEGSKYTESARRSMVTKSYNPLHETMGISDPNFNIENISESMRNVIFSRTASGSNNRDKGVITEQLLKGKIARVISFEETKSLPDGVGWYRYKNKGEEVFVAVDSDVADTVNKIGAITDQQSLEKFLEAYSKYGGAQLQRRVVTTVYPMFVALSGITDFVKIGTVSKAGVKNPTDAFRYTVDYIESFVDAVKGETGIGSSEWYRTAMREGALGTSIRAEFDPRYTGIRRLDPHRGFFEANVYTPWADDVVKAGKERGKAAVSAIGDVSSLFANVMERTGKLTAMRRLARDKGVTLPDDVNQWLRQNPEDMWEILHHSGSPYYARGSEGVKQASMILNFFNATVQGQAATWSRLTSLNTPEGRAASARLGLAIGAPTAYYASQVYSEKYRRYYDRVPESDRMSGLVIFEDPDDKGSFYYPLDKDGNPVSEPMLKYRVIPLREELRLGKNIIEGLYKDLIVDRIHGEQAAINAAKVLTSDLPVIGDAQRAFDRRDGAAALSSAGGPLKIYLSRRDGDWKDPYTGISLLGPRLSQATEGELRTTERVEDIYNDTAKMLRGLGSKMGLEILEGIGGADVKAFSDIMLSRQLSNATVSEYERKIGQDNGLLNYLMGSLAPSYYAQSMSPDLRKEFEKARKESINQRIRTENEMADEYEKFKKRTLSVGGNVSFEDFREAGVAYMNEKFPIYQGQAAGERRFNELRRTMFSSMMKEEGKVPADQFIRALKSLDSDESKIGPIVRKLNEMKRDGYTDQEQEYFMSKLINQKVIPVDMWPKVISRIVTGDKDVE